MKHKVALIILDGYGLSDDVTGNAILKANPKFINYLMSNYPTAKLCASGEKIGLLKNQSGNSEVGHLTIGAGQKLLNGTNLINHYLKQKDSDILIKAIKAAIKNQTNIHLVGLASIGLVHANVEHLYYLIDLCNRFKVKPILHLFSDGRDCGTHDFKEILININDKYCKKNKAIIGTVSGRWYAMDRNQNWDRTIECYEQMIRVASNDLLPIEYVEKAYSNNITDEYLKPTSFLSPISVLTENDTLIFFNYRSDRIRQLVHLCANSNAYKYHHQEFLQLNIITFTNYMIDNVNNFLFDYDKPKNTLGKIIAEHHLKQIRIAETEKYAHVTYFFDGLNMNKAASCDSFLIPSPTARTFAEFPKMSAKHVSEKIIDSLDKYDVIIANYANADMVGHSGDFKATVKAIKTVDKEIKKIYHAIKKNEEFILMITADHGNAEKLFDNNGIILTKHTNNLVPFILIDKTKKLMNYGDLTNIAATVLEYLNIPIPKSMNKSLIQKG